MSTRTGAFQAELSCEDCSILVRTTPPSAINALPGFLQAWSSANLLLFMVKGSFFAP